MKITRVKKTWIGLAQGRPIIVDSDLGGSFPVEPDPVHGYTMKTKVVAAGYGVTSSLILRKKRNLQEGLHYLTQPIGEMGQRVSTRWTRLGVVTLGVCLGESCLWEFALAASEEVYYETPEEALEEFIVPDDFRCCERLAILLNEQRLLRDLLRDENVVTAKSREALREAENNLEALIQPLKRKAEFFQELLEKKTAYPINMVWYALPIGLGPVNTFREFRKRGILINGGRLHNQPHHHWIEQGYFTDDPRKFVTLKGMKWIWENFQNNPTKSSRNRNRCEAEA